MARRAFEKAEDGVHYCEERFLEVARHYGVLGLPQQRVTLEEALATHAAHVRQSSPTSCSVHRRLHAVHPLPSFCTSTVARFPVHSDVSLICA